jgi:hypothetical protein
MEQISRRLFLGVGLCLALLAKTAAADLVTNGGFETGNFSGWTLSGTSQSVISVPADVHSGEFAVQFASFGLPLATVSQDLATAIGQTYEIDYWMMVRGNATPNEFKVTFGGNTLYDQTDIAGQAYTQYSFQLAATATTTTLQFGARNDPDWFYLDDVSVTAVPEPSSIVLAIGSLAGLASLLYRRRQSAS